MPRIIVLVFSLILSAPFKSISFFNKYVNDFNTGTIIFLKTDTFIYTRFDYNTSEVFKNMKKRKMNLINKKKKKKNYQKIKIDDNYFSPNCKKMVSKDD